MKQPYEIRRDPDGTVDEVVAENPTLFHLEYMDTDDIWIGVDMQDGTRIGISLTARGSISAIVEVGA